jgi:hypothetical protein
MLNRCDSSLLTFFSFSNAAFSFFSHFFADRCICLLTIRKLTISSSKETLFPIIVVMTLILGYEESTEARAMTYVEWQQH